ncbi:MAG: flagellar biosynthesis protein FlhF [Planctomycetes bacterium]|nr:flagellar biosynthesis protein FlhF [Planctomycetota bacterium]
METTDLQTIRAKTMAEALVEVKRRLGPDAVILHTRTVRHRGVLGHGGRRLVEITAARETFPLPGSSAGGRFPRGAGADGVVEGAPEAMPLVAQGSARGGADLTSVSTELKALKSTVVDLVRETQALRCPCPEAGSEQLRQVYQQLIESQVAEDIAGQLVRRVRATLSPEDLEKSSAVRTCLASYVESMLPEAGPIRLVDGSEPTVVALVGPTGVGKTTTIAKLAANHKLRQGRKVGLITVDSSRIAAAEQLRTYAEIIEVPLEIVTTPQRMASVIASMHERDVVFIDTAGRSQNDQAGLLELKPFLDAAKPHEVHLVLSGAYAACVLKEMFERFSVLSPDRVLFTKLDEAVGFGVILNCLQRAEARLSYVTTGQDVPDDIEVGLAARLAGLIVAGQRTMPAGSKVEMAV